MSVCICIFFFPYNLKETYFLNLSPSPPQSISSPNDALLPFFPPFFMLKSNLTKLY